MLRVTSSCMGLLATWRSINLCVLPLLPFFPPTSNLQPFHCLAAIFKADQATNQKHSSPLNCGFSSHASPASRWLPQLKCPQFIYGLCCSDWGLSLCYLCALTLRISTPTKSDRGWQRRLSQSISVPYPGAIWPRHEWGLIGRRPFAGPRGCITWQKPPSLSFPLTFFLLFPAGKWWRSSGQCSQVSPSYTLLVFSTFSTCVCVCVCILQIMFKLNFMSVTKHHECACLCVHGHVYTWCPKQYPCPLTLLPCCCQGVSIRRNFFLTDLEAVIGVMHSG